MPFSISEEESLSVIDVYIEAGLTPEDLGADIASYTSPLPADDINKKTVAKRRMKRLGVLWYGELEKACLGGREIPDVDRLRAM